MSPDISLSIGILDRWANEIYGSPFRELGTTEQSYIRRLWEASEIGVEELLRREREQVGPRLVGGHSSDVERLALDILLPDAFWSLLVRHCRWSIAEYLVKRSPEARGVWGTFRNLDSALAIACMKVNGEHPGGPPTRVKDIFQQDGLKVIASRAEASITNAWVQPRIIVTSQPVPYEAWTLDAPLEFVLRPSGTLGANISPVTIQVKPSYAGLMATEPIIIDCPWPGRLENDTAHAAYFHTLFDVVQRMAVRYRELTHDRYSLLLPPERLWAYTGNPQLAMSQHDVLSSILRYLVGEVMGDLLGQCVAWIFAPPPKNSTVLTVLAGTEAYPRGDYEAISVVTKNPRWLGLCGRAWIRNRMEISLDAQHDPRVANAAVERVGQAVAIPLTLARPDLPTAGNATMPDQALWLCKLGVLYFGVRDSNLKLKPHHILMLRHFSQIVASYLAKVLFAEYARASAVEDLRVGYLPLLEWLNPDQEWYRENEPSEVVQWIASRLDELEKGDGFQWQMAQPGAESAGFHDEKSDQVNLIILRIDQADRLSQPPGSDRDVASLVSELKKKIRDWLELAPVLKDVPHLVADYEHDLLVVAIGLVAISGVIRNL